MHRRQFLQTLTLAALAPTLPQTRAAKLVLAARNQLGVTTGYDPTYTRIPYPMGDVPRSTGVCADVIIRAYRDALTLDLQPLVHDDMAAHFPDYPHTWGNKTTDRNIDHRRVLNLETFWRRSSAQLWSATATTPGDAFPAPIRQGDIVTWLLDGRLPHVGLITYAEGPDIQVVHNIGSGTQLNQLADFHPHHAKAHFRWQLT